LVIPRSFISGSLFAVLRRHLRTHCDLVSLDLIDKRKGVFLDVGQDICVLVVRKRYHARTAFEADTVPCAVLSLTEGLEILDPVTLPADASAPWLLPAIGGDCRGGTATIADYGYTVRSGYFVWNREGHRMRTEPSADAFPLVWAHNIKAGKPCVPISRKREAGVDYVHFLEPGPGIIRNPSVVLQRTTNGKQPRRLVPAVVDPSILATHGGFTAENHVIVAFSNRDGAAEPELMARLLGSREVDRRYRRIAGGTNISTRLLRGLALPQPKALAKAIADTADFDEAVAKAYEQDKEQSPEERRVADGLHQGPDQADETGDGGSPSALAGQCPPPQKSPGRAAAE
jgi:adenine-specific DNA-methyltransferase